MLQRLRGRPWSARRPWTTEPTAEDWLCRDLPHPFRSASTYTRARQAGPGPLVCSLVTGPPDMFLLLYFPSWLDTDLLLLQGPAQASTFPEAPRDRSGPGDDPPAQSHMFQKALWGQARATLAKRLASQKLGSFRKRDQDPFCLGMAQDCCDEEYAKAFCARPRPFLLFILLVHTDRSPAVYDKCFLSAS